jgi:hypothetical protein
LEIGGRRRTDENQCGQTDGQDLGEHFKIGERFDLLGVQELRVRFARRKARGTNGYDSYTL